MDDLHIHALKTGSLQTKLQAIAVITLQMLSETCQKLSSRIERSAKTCEHGWGTALNCGFCFDDLQNIKMDRIENNETFQELIKHLGSKENFYMWLDTPQKELGEDTPSQYIASGHLGVVESLAHDIIMMVPD